MIKPVINPLLMVTQYCSIHFVLQHVCFLSQLSCQGSIPIVSRTQCVCQLHQSLRVGVHVLGCCVLQLSDNVAVTLTVTLTEACKRSEMHYTRNHMDV